MIISGIQSPKPEKDPVEAMASKISMSEVKHKEINRKIIASEVKIKENSKEVREVSDEKINRIAELMDKYVRSIQTDIQIQVHGATGKIMVKVISEETGKVIREIPSKELLDLAVRMEEMSGILFDQNV